MTFQAALPIILRHEGGYTDHPHDPGGATNQGVTQATYDAWRRGRGLPERPVREIAPAEVQRIYLEHYWIPARCGELPAELRLAHFDAAVNCGVQQAAKFLQRALGVTADGVVGPITLRAAAERPSDSVLEGMLWGRLRYYRDIAVRQRPDGRDLRVFLAGWIGRVLSIRDTSIAGATP